MAKKKEKKIETKEHLIATIRAKKKDLQQARFRFSPELQRNSSRRRMLRKDIARASSALSAKRTAGGEQPSGVQ